MKIDIMTLADIPLVLPMYVDYYNTCEGSCWTEVTAQKRIQQVLKMDDSYSLIMRLDNGEICGFVMGYYKQYDDIVGYTLEEIVIARQHQNKGLGTLLMAELQSRVKASGASCIELQAVNDQLHEHFYGKAGFHDAKNFVLKTKWLD